jgi:UDP-N-acetylglucosamine--N-acetylmuramyl-(pentapeptide) pyrophosphoryl-undecaprenol N-acetylglucosamine transferase
MSQKRTILIMAGGTGGHVFPGLAVAHQLQEQGYNICWLGTPQGIESKLVPAAGIPLEYISINGLRGKGWKSLFAAPWKLVKAISQALKIVNQIKPCAVVGMGGFAAGPGGLAARILNKPLIIHEQNAISGYTNRALALFAKRVLMSFPHTFPQRCNPILTGNPLRKEFFCMDNPDQRFSNRKGAIRLLILGGSQGAAALNNTVPEALALLSGHEIEVIHSTGVSSLEKTQQTYNDKGFKVYSLPTGDKADITNSEIKGVKVAPFIKDMAEAYAWADLCICRSGALTVAEICAVGVGAIFIPFPFAVDDHQTKNAQPLVAAGAAQIVQQKDLTAPGLAKILEELITNKEKLVEMARAAHQLSSHNATTQVVEQIVEVCNAAK